MGTVLTLQQALETRLTLQQTGKKLVFTNGHFDLLHTGHLDYLEKARSLGDALYVGVNGDKATRILKGEGRPIVPGVDRVRLIAALCCVDAAILFEENTATSLI